jgi:hypothetical protein
MDGSKWAKFCRDNNLIVGKVTTTEVDIIFNKVKVKAARKITFGEFQAALRVIAAHRYPSLNPTAQFNKIGAHICQSESGPSTNSSTKLSNDPVVLRLTDTTKYTGTSKERFDADGKGINFQEKKSNSLADLADRKPAYIRGVNVQFKPNPGPLTKTGYTSSVSKLSNDNQKVKRSIGKLSTGSTEALDKTIVPFKRVDQKSSNSNLNSKGSGSSNNVFNRLTDSKAFTGSHNERFDDFGKGKGLKGRDTVKKDSMADMTERSPVNIRGVNLNRF